MRYAQANGVGCFFGIRDLRARGIRWNSATVGRPPLSVYHSLWGAEGIEDEESREKYFSKLKLAGYAGVETGPFIVGTGGGPKWDVDPVNPARDKFAEAIRRHGLGLIGMVHSAG
jgi:hypothetical protein